jgi:hypothetical protein
MDKDNWQRVSETDNKFLNLIGNICGWISGMFLKPYIRWGTMWTYELDDDIIDEQATSVRQQLIDEGAITPFGEEIKPVERKSNAKKKESN